MHSGCRFELESKQYEKDFTACVQTVLYKQTDYIPTVNLFRSKALQKYKSYINKLSKTKELRIKV